jgi:hypothetical protein
MVGGWEVDGSLWAGHAQLSSVFPSQVVKVGSVWDASFCVSFLPSVVLGGFGSEDPVSPRIYPSYYLIDISWAGKIYQGGVHLRHISYDY